NHNASYPVKQLESGVSYLTNQNSHYIVNRKSVDQSNIEITYEGLNDQTVQGLALSNKNLMSVQFNPEGSPGTNEANFVFDDFLNSISKNYKSGVINMPKNESIKKILVIGSGPIVIGQAAEFDYSGTQACQSLKEEGYSVVLANSNPATIMTDHTVADKVYMEPLPVKFLTKIIKKERPDALLATLGGQTGLNIAIELDKAGVLEQYDVKLLGSSLDAIQKAEDRELFRDLMDELNEPVPASDIVNNVESAVDFATKIGYPVIVRPAFILGGTGGGMCDNEEELRIIVKNGLALSPANQCLIEKSIAGFKEIEYEVIRDSKDQAIAVCNMENIDPVGIHTGDAIVVAPSMTLTDHEYHMLRDVSLKIIRALKIEG